MVVEMSKQATLTSFFHARKATADGADLHAIKKRKVELQDDLGKNVSQNAMACSLKIRILMQLILIFQCSP